MSAFEHTFSQSTLHSPYQHILSTHSINTHYPPTLVPFSMSPPLTPPSYPPRSSTLLVHPLGLSPGLHICRPFPGAPIFQEYFTPTHSSLSPPTSYPPPLIPPSPLTPPLVPLSPPLVPPGILYPRFLHCPGTRLFRPRRRPPCLTQQTSPPQQ